MRSPMPFPTIHIVPARVTLLVPTVLPVCATNNLALKTKEDEMKRRWHPKIFVIQDEISLVPAAVENMMLYRSMRARQDEGLDPPSYAQPGELMGHIPILLIAGDFLQIKPANEISFGRRSGRASPQDAAQGAIRALCCSVGADEH